MYKETASESDYMPRPQWMLDMYKQKAKRYATCGKTNLTAKETEKLAVATMIANGEAEKWGKTLQDTYEPQQVRAAFSDCMGMNVTELLDTLEVGDSDSLYNILIVRVK